jgi:hypothetical protein
MNTMNRIRPPRPMMSDHSSNCSTVMRGEISGWARSLTGSLSFRERESLCRHSSESWNPACLFIESPAAIPRLCHSEPFDCAQDRLREESRRCRRPRMVLAGTQGFVSAAPTQCRHSGGGLPRQIVSRGRNPGARPGGSRDPEIKMDRLRRSIPSVVPAWFWRGPRVLCRLRRPNAVIPAKAGIQ